MNPDKTIKSPEGLQTPTQVDLEASPGAVQAPLTAGASVQPRLRTQGRSKHLISLIPPRSQRPDY